MLPFKRVITISNINNGTNISKSNTFKLTIALNIAADMNPSTNKTHFIVAPLYPVFSYEYYTTVKVILSTLKVILGDKILFNFQGSKNHYSTVKVSYPIKFIPIVLNFIYKTREMLARVNLVFLVFK